MTDPATLAEDVVLELACQQIEQRREAMRRYGREADYAISMVRRILDTRDRKSWKRPDGRRVRIVQREPLYDASGERIPPSWYLSLEKANDE
tara:strand:+ start:550 stop:825 length:276 start_codon:yes stop_codon:yes gene_type:complete